MRTFVTLAAAALAVAVAAPAAAQDLTGTLKKIKDSGKVVMGARDASAPLSYTLGGGQYTGYHVELCQRILDRIKTQLKMPALQIEYTLVTSQNRIPLVENGTVDIECGSTTASLSRQEKVDFTLMTFVDGASLLIVEGAGVRTLGDLAGKRIGVVPGTTTERAVAEFLRTASLAATVVPVKDHDEGLAGLQTSKLEAYASDRTILLGLVVQARGTARYALISEDLSYEPYGFMVRRDDSAFRLVANRALARTYRSGAIGAIYARWFGAMGKPTPALVLMYALQGLPE
jgi:glutamate/aspartate transport system substrate-binding protein